MKNIVLVALLLSGLSLIQSCSKEEGPTGPQGPTGLTGATGATGATGVAGQNGISGAVAFEFSDLTPPIARLMLIDSSIVESSAVMVYYKDASLSNALWYTAPGLGASGDYQTRYYITVNPVQTSINLNLHNPDGSAYTGSAVTFSKVKVVFIPYTLTGKKEAVDLNDYKATMKYYGLAE